MQSAGITRRKTARMPHVFLSLLIITPLYPQVTYHTCYLHGLFSPCLCASALKRVEGQRNCGQCRKNTQQKIRGVPRVNSAYLRIFCMRAPRESATHALCLPGQGGNGER